MKLSLAATIVRVSLAATATVICLEPQTSLLAQNLQDVAEREIVRRQEDLVVAERLIIAGDRALAEKDYETAYVNYLDALEKIPAGIASGNLRSSTLSKFIKTALRYAEQLIENGRYSDAEKVAKTILLPDYDPSNKAAIQLLSNLEQPDYYNKTVTPDFAEDREEVTKLLHEADEFYQVGRFDLATKRYEQVLNIDRYNIAARKGMEQVSLAKAKYYGAAYNETRSRLLWLVDKSWERPVHRFQRGRTTTAEIQARGGVRGTEATMAKLNRIIIPRIDLRDTTVREAVEFLKQRSRELDTSTDDPQGKRGVNIVLKLNPSRPDLSVPPAEGPTPAPLGGTADTRVTLSLTNVPLIEALRYLTELAGLKYKIEPYAVSIVPITENTTDLITKKYRVPPGFIPAGPVTGAEIPSPGAAREEVLEPRIGSRTNALEYLQSQGVTFPTGAFAQYVPASSELIVRNTPDAIDLIDSLVDAAIGVQPTQVEIESKFLEITQNNVNELGFDWLLGPLQIGNSGAFAAGGTQGFGTNLLPTFPNPANFPFAPGGVPVGQNPVTGGLRSGFGFGPNAAITANSIDALLGTTVIGTAPGIFGIAGIFTNPQFQVVIRALNQKKGVDLMSAPKVTTKSGRKAIVRVAREFPYPTEFNAPEPPPPSTVSGLGSTVGPPPGSFVSQGVVTPSTPTAFETRNLGVTLEVEPIIGPDGYTIDLNLSPEVVEFDGFINYGSTINGPIFNPLTQQIDTAILTQNVINQPIFSTRKVTTSVSIWDGQTVALGGLVREDVQKVQDKVPILGDIPLAGRLFRSNVDQKIKRNLIIFVTARLMDAEGRPVRLEEDIEEIVEPLGLPQELQPPVYESPTFGK
jgi:Flp pilus assembly secretin CpaC/tetratricopeptide (TPR) repeat protein